MDDVEIDPQNKTGNDRTNPSTETASKSKLNMEDLFGSLFSVLWDKSKANKTTLSETGDSKGESTPIEDYVDSPKNDDSTGKAESVSNESKQSETKTEETLNVNNVFEDMLPKLCGQLGSMFGENLNDTLGTIKKAMSQAAKISEAKTFLLQQLETCTLPEAVKRTKDKFGFDSTISFDVSLKVEFD